MPQPFHILAVASEFKGAEFIKECKAQGCTINVLVTERFKDHPWPHDCIDQFHVMPDVRRQPDLKHAVSYFARHNPVDRIVALDDYDVEHTADLREHLRLPGMGHSTARLFRDKLAMRSQARIAGLLEPRFTGIFNYQALDRFLAEVPPPWIFKPRMLAGSEGIQKIHDRDQFWNLIEPMGDKQSEFLLEEFIPGDVFHVDSLCWRGEVIFTLASKYGAPPLAALQGKGIFSTRVIDRGSEEAAQLTRFNERVVKTMGRAYGPTHTEFIRGEDGQFRFLETSARVAGGNIEKVFEAATGLNIWKEAAKMEIADFRDEEYNLPDLRAGYGGLIACPDPDQNIDIHSFQESEIHLAYHADGFVSFVLGTESETRLEHLLANFAERLLTR